MGLLLLRARGAAAARNEIVPWSPTQEKGGKPGAEPASRETQNGPRTDDVEGLELPTAG